ncbi:MAG: hypothetical protein WCC10_01305, partial [Tumebacillaceae bacterium]
ETRLLEQEIPQEHIQHLLQTIHESRNIHQIERHLHQQGLSTHLVERIVQTLLHPQVLQKHGASTQQPAQAWQAQRSAPARTQHRGPALPIDYGEVLQRGVPQLRQEFQRLTETSTFRLIEKQLQTLGVQSHHVQQIFQTLLHPQVLKAEGVHSQPIQMIVQTLLHPQVLMNLEASLFQDAELRFDHPQSDDGEPALRFEHRELEKRLLEQRIPMEQIQQVLPALTQRSTFRQIEKYLTERGLPQQTVQQVMYTLLHPRVLRSTADRTLMNRVLRWSRDRTTRQESNLRFHHREVERRLLAQSLPVQQIQRVLQTLNESSTFAQIEKRLTQRGLSTHQIQQVMQTLLHPQVRERTHTERTVIQTATHSLDHREPSLLVPDSTRTQLDRAIEEATQVHRVAADILTQRSSDSYGGGAPIEYYRPKPADPPPPPPAPAAPPEAPPVEVVQKVKLENFAPDDLQRLIDRIYSEIEKRAKFERSLRGL